MLVTVWVNEGPPIEMRGSDEEKLDQAFSVIKSYINTQNSHLILNFGIVVRS